MDIFYDNKGVFQWSSVTAIIGVIVFMAQVIQFRYMQKETKKNKKWDVLIEFRVNDLKKLKEYIIQFDEQVCDNVLDFGSRNLNTRDSLSMLINEENEWCEDLQQVLLDLTNLEFQCKEREPTRNEIVDILKKSTNLTKTYKKYEKQEILNLEKYYKK